MRLSFLLLAFVSFPVLACPNLAGTYNICRSSLNQDSVSSVSIAQKVVNKYNQYTVTTRDVEVSEESERIEIYTADGKTKTVTDIDADTGITIKTQTLTSCANNILNIKLDATLDAEVFANMTIKVSKDGNRLVQVFSGTSMGEEVNETVTCE